MEITLPTLPHTHLVPLGEEPVLQQRHRLMQRHDVCPGGEPVEGGHVLGGGVDDQLLLREGGRVGSVEGGSVEGQQLEGRGVLVNEVQVRGALT